MARPPRIGKAEWAAKNPPREGETREQYKQRYEDETSPTIPETVMSNVRDFGRGAVSGGFRGLGSTVRAIGDIVGSKTLRSGGRDMETMADLYGQETMDDPTGMAGRAGDIAGRVGFEVASAMGGTGAAKTLLTKGIPAAAKVIPGIARFAAKSRRAGRAIESGTRFQRALKSAAVSAPVDIVQGVGQGEGMLLPGAAGAIAENIFFSGAGGAIGGARDVRAAERAERGPLPIRDPRRLLTSGQPNPIPDSPPIPMGGATTGPRALLTAGEPPVPTSGQVFNMPGQIATPADRGVAVAPYRNAPATPVSPEFAQAGEEVSREVQAARREFDRLPQWQKKMIMEEQLGPLEDVSDAEIAEFLARATMRGGAAPPEEMVQSFINAGEAAQRSSKIPKITASKKKPSKKRSGVVEGELLSGLAGAGVGGMSGYAAGETDEERLALALLGAGGGAFLGSRAPRFFGDGASSRAPIGQTIREEQQDILKEARRKASQQPPPPSGQPSPRPTGPAGPLPKNRQNLLDKQNLSVNERMQVEADIARFEQTIQRPVTEADVRKEAATLLGRKTVDDLLNLEPARTNPAEYMGMLNAHKNIREQISQRLDQIAQSVDDAEITKLKEEVESLDNYGTRLIQNLMLADTAAGRALKARQYMAAQIKNPTFWHIKGSKAKGQYGVLSAAEKAEIDKMVAAGDSEGLLKYMASLQKSSKLEQIAQIRSAGLLTAIPGRLRDLISTSANYMSTIAQRAPGAVVDAALARLAADKIGGQAGAFRTVAAPTVQELQAAGKGAMAGLEKAKQSMGFGAKSMEEWINHIRTAEIDPDMMRQLDLPSVINIDLFGDATKAARTGNVILDTYTKSIMRLSGVTDKVLREAAFRGALTEQAQLGAIRRGLKGQAADDFVKQALAKPDDEMLLNAQTAAEYIAFTNDGRLADALSGGIERIVGALGRDNPRTAALTRAAARFILPFRRTPANILSRALEYAPGTGQALALRSALDWQRELATAALAGSTKGTALAAKQRKLVERLTKQATGLGMFALGAHLYNKGVLTGDFPDQPAEQEQWRLEGKQPESILIGGQWLPISRISPYGGMLTMAATIMKDAEEKPDRTLSQQLLSGGATALRTTLNQPMVTGPNELLTAVTNKQKDEQGTIDRVVQSMAGSFVPTFISQAARAEGVQRQPQSITEAVASRVPGLQDVAPARLNIFGEPVQKSEGLINTMINPLTGTPDVRQRDPLVQEMADVGAEVGAMRRKKGETLEMYQYRQREAGAFVREDLQTLIASEEYRLASKDEKRQLIEETVKRARRDLDAYLKSEYNIDPQQES